MSEEINVESIQASSAIRVVSETDSMPKREYPHADSTLMGHLYAAECFGGQAPVTLWVGGLLVTGNLTSQAGFLRAFADQYEAMPDGAGLEHARVYREMADLSAKRVADAGEDFIPQAVYLLESRTFIPGVGMVPNNRPVPWAGRAGAIDGWTEGRYEVGGPASS